MKRILLQLVDGQPTAFASRGEVKEWWNRKGAEWEIGVKGRKAVGEETERERVDVPVVQKPPSEVATTEDEEGAFTWAPALGEERRVLGALWGEGREQETAGGQRRGRNGWDEVVG